MEKIEIEIVGSDNCSFSIFLYIKCLKNWKESFALPWAMARTCSNFGYEELDLL
jgi:hypothetical protein